MNLRKAVLAVAMALASTPLTQANGWRVWRGVLVKVPLQEVVFVNGVGEFGATVGIRWDGVARGLMKIQFPNQRTRTYKAIAGGWVEDKATGEIGVKILLCLLRDGILQRGGFLVARARPHPNVPGCDIWEFQSNNYHDACNAMGSVEGLDHAFVLIGNLD